MKQKGPNPIIKMLENLKKITNKMHLNYDVNNTFLVSVIFQKTSNVMHLLVQDKNIVNLVN